MKMHGVMQMMKTVGTITPLGNNRFLVKWGLHSETIIQVEEAAQQSVQRIVGYAGPSEHGTYSGHEVGCICGLCVSTPANR